MYPFGEQTKMRWLGATLFIFLVGCQPNVAPSIYPPPSKIPVKADPRKLPPGAKAILPAYDGEGFFVSIPPKKSFEVSATAVSAEMVYDDTVSKVLEAIGGFDPKSKSELKRLGNQGIDMPKANLEGFAKTTCTRKKLSGAKGKKQEAWGICDVLVAGLKPGSQLNKRFLDSYGMTFRQYKTGIERQEIQYFFPQVRRTGPSEHSLIQGIPETVPIEHAGVLATRWQGQSITSVVGRVIISEPIVTNIVKLTPQEAENAGREALKTLRGISDAARPERVELLLLPYGEAKRDGRVGPALRYAYRMPIVARFNGAKGLFYLWLDAETEKGKILELQPLIHAVVAEGRTFHQSPDLPPNPEPAKFEVDPSQGGQFWLRLSGAFDLSNSVNSMSVPDNQSGIADFNVTPSEDLNCESNDTKFQQVDLMATLSQYRNQAISVGLSKEFPQNKISVSFDDFYRKDKKDQCNASGGPTHLNFYICKVGSSAVCGSDAKVVRASYDHTMVAHELAHALIPHQYTNRPRDWCGSATSENLPCPVPNAPVLFHDFADVWAHAFEDTNCMGDWFGKAQKNVPQGGNPSPLDCDGHDENDGWPRKSEVIAPFKWLLVPGDTEGRFSPGDHFPEHRQPNSQYKWPGYTGEYADMQIAAAALWAVRQGMRSKDFLPTPYDPSPGAVQYLNRFVRALPLTGWNGVTPSAAGWFGLSSLTIAEWFGNTAPSSTDRDIYLGLLDLELQFANQWAGAGSSDYGAHMTNKVTAGFAKAGIFLIPVVCIDGDKTTKDPDWCSNGENAADAVIDIDDDDTTDDPVIDGVSHPEGDYLKRDGGVPPKFLVWTGPRYAFQKDGTAIFPTTAPCNEEFQVEVANDVDAQWNLKNPMISNVIKVRLDPADPSAQCYGEWKVPQEMWGTLERGDRLYYKVTTKDASGQSVRTSTLPGNGLFQVPPSYAIVTVTGRPEPPGGAAATN